MTSQTFSRVLLQQVDAWEQANRVRAYLAAMADRSVHIEDPEKAVGAERWLEWFRLRMSSLDPLERTIGYRRIRSRRMRL